MHDSRKVLLIGMGVTTESALRGLLGRFHVVGLVRQADSSDAAVRLAVSHHVPIESDMSVAAVRRFIDVVDPSCVVVSSYNRILPADLVSVRPFVNVHYAPLPRYRGRATVNWAIINGESHAAISVHVLRPDLDAGGILYQELVPIGDRDNVTDLYQRLNEIQCRELPLAVGRLLDGEQGAPQDEAAATYTCTRLPSDGEIDWRSSAADIDRLIRALTDPFPGAFTWIGTRRVTVDRALPLRQPRYEGAVPGRVAQVNRDDGSVDVLTGDGLIRILDMRVDGRPVRPAEVLNSLSCTLGLSVSYLLSNPTKLFAAGGRT